MKTKSYKDLIVWQKALELVILVYRLTSRFPKEEMYGLVSQMRRAAVAIISNIAEGYARRYRGEYKQFLSVSYSSGAELETQLIISEKLGFGDKQLRDKIFALQDEVSRMLRVMLERL